MILVQIWLDSGTRQVGVDLVLDDDLSIDGDALYVNGRQVGRRVDVSTSEGQAQARAMAGSVEWILLDLGEWKMIPIENVIASCDGGPQSCSKNFIPEQVLGAAFALEIGVDALLVPEDILPTALIAKSQRGERIEPMDEEKPEEFELTSLRVIEVREGG